MKERDEKIKFIARQCLLNVSLDPQTNEVSIHAPVKGATRIVGRYLEVPRSFNPRPREGGDGSFPVT